MKGDIFKAQSLEELQKMGKITEIRVPLREMAGKYNIKIRVKSWDDVWDSIQIVKKVAPDLIDKETPPMPPVKEEWDDPYFKNLEAKTIYYLLHVSGEEKTNFLGITRKHYSDKALARSWMLEKMKLIHPDNCHHPYAAKAADAVTRLYESMMGR